MASRENIQVRGTGEEFSRNLNFALQRISDRLDKIEGIRGGSKVESDLDLSGNSLINAANYLPRQEVEDTDSPTFVGLTIDDGVLTVFGVNSTTVINGDQITIIDDNGTTIHKLGG